VEESQSIFFLQTTFQAFSIAFLVCTHSKLQTEAKKVFQGFFWWASIRGPFIPSSKVVSIAAISFQRDEPTGFNTWRKVTHPAVGPYKDKKKQTPFIF